MGKAIFEWIYFYAVLFNKEKLAKRTVRKTENRYDCTAKNAQSSFTEPKLVAVWAYYSDYPGYEGWRIATCDPKYNYYCEYTDACNINLLHSSTSLSDSQFVEFAKDADILFYSSDSWDKWYVSGEKKEVLDQLKSVQDQQVFDHELSGDGTWWEQRMAEYDVVLEDICTIGGMVTDKNAPLVSRATECEDVSKPKVNCNKKCKSKRSKKKKQKCKKACRKANEGRRLLKFR